MDEIDGGVARQIRQAAGLSQRAVAEATGFSQAMISLMENGKESVKPDYLPALHCEIERRRLRAKSEPQELLGTIRVGGASSQMRATKYQLMVTWREVVEVGLAALIVKALR